MIVTHSINPFITRVFEFISSNLILKYDEAGWYHF